MKIANKSVKFCPICGTAKEKWDILHYQEHPYSLSANCKCGLKITSQASKQSQDKNYRYTVWYKA